MFDDVATAAGQEQLFEQMAAPATGAHPLPFPVVGVLMVQDLHAAHMQRSVELMVATVRVSQVLMKYNPWLAPFVR